MQTNNFRVTVVEEYDVVEICGALKVGGVWNTVGGREDVLSNCLQILSLCLG